MLNLWLRKMSETKSKKQILLTRASMNGYPDKDYIPKMELGSTHNHLRFSGYFLNGPCDYYYDLQPVENQRQLIQNSVNLCWSNRPVRDFNAETFDKFCKEQDLEYKNIFAILHNKSQCYQNKPVEPKLFNDILDEYLYNLVFTRWLYKDFVEYKHHVKAQKRKKRLNYQQNVRQRSFHYE